MKLDGATAADLPAIQRLLASSALPTDDVDAGLLRNFLVLRDGTTLAGVVGLEIHGEVGLLRSLAVPAAQQKAGLGAALVVEAEDLAVRRGVHQLFLLTTTAAEFFARRGFAPTDRAQAPAAVAATPQFASLCPSSAAFMSKALPAPQFRVLFLCTGNSARSVLAEVAMNTLPATAGRFRAYSAGSQPKGRVNPHALRFLRAAGLPTDGLRSKSWDEFGRADGPKMDFIFTVCDQAAGEACPFWPGRPVTAHWGMPDPAAVEGSDEAIGAAFAETFRVLRRRIERFASLPLATLDRSAVERQAQGIGTA